MRYFIEISYKGTGYSGFQTQQNANTVQAEVEKALNIYFKRDFSLTGSSRTDAGVHALQNYFHFDVQESLTASAEKSLQQFVYHLNAILPADIVIKRIFPVSDDTHCRFDAEWREYQYFIYKKKDPFLDDRAYYFPYNTDLEILKGCADALLSHTDFTSFSKKNTQVHTFICHLEKSEWIENDNTLIYSVRSNRFLRGMVKGLVGTMLRAGTGKMSVSAFEKIIESRDCTKADFSVPSHGLFLVKVSYPHF